MSSSNPFSAPAVRSVLGQLTNPTDNCVGHYWVEGDILVMEKEGVALPDRCVKCNQPSDFRHVQKVQWVPMWARLLFGGLLMLLFRKTAHLDVGLCDTHREQVRVAKLVGGVGILLGIMGFIGGLFLQWMPIVAIGFIGMIFGILFLAFRGTVLRPVKIDGAYARYKGADPMFLDSLR